MERNIEGTNQGSVKQKIRLLLYKKWPKMDQKGMKSIWLKPSAGARSWPVFWAIPSIRKDKSMEYTIYNF